MKERGLRSRGFRRLISEALDAFAERIEDDLPAALRQRLGFDELGASLRQVHFPASLAEAERARQRLAFGELFAFQLRLARRCKKNNEQADGIAFAPSEKLVPALWDSLPFAPDSRPTPGRRRDRRADAAPPSYELPRPGRRRLGQDPSGPELDVDGCGEWLPSGDDGPDRDSRRAALF